MDPASRPEPDGPPTTQELVRGLVVAIVVGAGIIAILVWFVAAFLVQPCGAGTCG